MAVTDLAADMVTAQGPVPVQLPLHPAKVDPTTGAAVRVTIVLAVAAAVVLRNTVFGRRVFALGSNEQAARAFRHAVQSRQRLSERKRSGEDVVIRAAK